MRGVGFLAVLMAAAPGAFTGPLAGEPAAIAVDLALDGPFETVFDWSSDRCELWDIPDAPARAWRDDAGVVRLVAGAERSRVSSGPALGALERRCEVLHEGAHLDDPGAYDDRTWIAATYVHDDGEVEALAHVEYHGHKRPAVCRAGDYLACWRNVVVALRSDDGGTSFRRAPYGAALVAALPYRYGAGDGRRAGYFNPSNMLRAGDHLFAFIFAERLGAQRRGPCLIRRPVDGGAADWRAWDGHDFTIRFLDPYRVDLVDPERHVCAPVEGVDSTISSVVRHEASGLWIAVTPAARRGPSGAETVGIWWTASADLTRWDQPRLLMEAPLLWRRDCGADAAYAYPSLLDDDSASRNFESVDGVFWLYLTRLPVDGGCAVGPERDLIRAPVRITPRAPR